MIIFFIIIIMSTDVLLKYNNTYYNIYGKSTKTLLYSIAKFADNINFDQVEVCWPDGKCNYEYPKHELLAGLSRVMHNFQGMYVYLFDKSVYFNYEKPYIAKILNKINPDLIPGQNLIEQIFNKYDIIYIKLDPVLEADPVQVINLNNCFKDISNRKKLSTECKTRELIRY